VSYWTPGWPLGFGDNSGPGQGADTYGNFPSFDGSAGRFSSMRYNFSNGWFVGSARSGIGLNGPAFSGINQAGAFGNVGEFYREGMQFGYSFKNGSGLPLTVYGGFDTLKYKSGIGGLAGFDSTSGTVPGYSARAGIEFQPAPNVSLSVGVGYTQQSTGRIDSDINSPLLPGESPFALVGRR